jgi:(2Fe-2S) ferredoxin
VIEQSTRSSTGVSGTRAGPVCYVVVCRGPHCRERGGLPLRKRLVELLRREPRTRLVGYACFGQCDFGPNVAFYPEGTWYGGLSAAGAAESVARHAAATQALEATPLSLPEAERVEHLKNIAELVNTLERDSQHTRRWWWPF